MSAVNEKFGVGSARSVVGRARSAVRSARLRGLGAEVGGSGSSSDLSDILRLQPEDVATVGGIMTSSDFGGLMSVLYEATVYDQVLARDGA